MNNNNIEDEKTKDIQIPLNILKEKIIYCLHKNSEIDDDAVVLINQSVNYFLKTFTKSIQFDNKKIMLKHIKHCIDSDKNFVFLKKLTDK